VVTLRTGWPARKIDQHKDTIVSGAWVAVIAIQVCAPEKIKLEVVPVTAPGERDEQQPEDLHTSN